jgi:glycosyltransferase involved in cell wall biosynthesis
MDLSVIIADSNDLRVKDCIGSIDEDVETLVSLNAPSKELSSLVKDMGVKFCYSPKKGLSLALNNGIAHAKYNNVLIIDSDCTFEKGAIKHLYSALESSPMARGIQIYDSDNLISRVIANARNFHANPIPHLDGVIRAYKPLAFKKDIVSSLGGYYYDEDLKLSEDYEMDIRRQKVGLNIAYVPEAAVHHCPLTLAGDIKSAFKYGADRHTSVTKGETKPKKKFFDSMVKLRDKALPKIGPAATAYMILWTMAYDTGYNFQKYFDINGVKKC